jgi:hypothetical protein
MIAIKSIISPNREFNGGNAELGENSTKSDLFCQERLYDMRSNMSINDEKDSKLTL